MLEEIDTMKYYLSKEEFQDTMLHLEDHKSKNINNNGFNFGKTVEFVTIKRRVSNYSSKENPNPCKKKHLALEAIEKYYDRRGFKRKLGFAGLGIDEDRRQCSRKKIVIEADTYNMNLLADACCSIEKIAKVKSRKYLRKAVKMKKRGSNGKTKKGKDTRDYDLTKVDYKLPYLEKIKKLNNGRNEQLIAQKQLTASDINSNLGRLLINQKNIIAEEEFLRDAEEKKIKRKDEYIKAKLLEPMGRIQDIHVTNWDMDRNSYYVLLNTWKDLVASNGFGKNDVVQVWTFRFDGEVPDQLGVAVVRIFTAPRESSTTSGSSGESNGTGCLCSS